VVRVADGTIGLNDDVGKEEVLGDNVVVGGIVVDDERVGGKDASTGMVMLGDILPVGERDGTNDVRVG
jgi:hypothetical protein